MTSVGVRAARRRGFSGEAVGCSSSFPRHGGRFGARACAACGPGQRIPVSTLSVTCADDPGPTRTDSGFAVGGPPPSTTAWTV